MLTITVIIATYNRSRFLAEALKSLLAQERDGSFDMDVIVVDNNSTDNTKDVVESFIPAFDRKLRYLFENQQGKSHALNKGIQEATGEIIAFTDDDAIPDPQWLRNITYCFLAYQCDGLGGRILPQYPPRSPKWVMDNKDLIVGPVVCYDYGEEVKLYQKPMYEFLGVNLAFKRDLFKEHGFFRTDIGPGKKVLGEDTEITSRFLEAGKRLYYCGNAVVRHPVVPERMTVRYITAWYVALGRYRVIMDRQSVLQQDRKYFCYVPGHLLKRFASEARYLVTHVFNQRELLRAWVDLCVTYGKISQIRKIRKSQTETP